ncbi:zinc finger protein 770-like isoform X2 [Leptidea sinapis]|uniref:zinc finger protein 770-like isoform X2 n=1 Tax=Leptidea sinapis TaxID=189913 RepID=UPI0021370638|nr:zinc finger protein 770-like isoform X2 [Leptidea sinapis]XP_050676424.1 zinc finger protein 770-like isoform X2 [Leptidea sinapis]
MSSINQLSIAHGSGDFGAVACCRLCGGNASLRFFSDTYRSEGVEERYDQLLYDSFGIRVTPNDCMICERCARQLRQMQRFRALVLAAFAKPPSEYSTQHSQTNDSLKVKMIRRTKKTASIELYKKSSKESSRVVLLRRSFKNSGESFLKRSNKSSLDLFKKGKKLSGPDLSKQIKTKTGAELSKKSTKTLIRKNGKKSLTKTNAPLKRINISCSVCQQKFPMLIPSEGSKNFVCSRCKKNSGSYMKATRSYNRPVPHKRTKDHLDVNSRSDVRQENRLQNPKLPKRASQTTQIESGSALAQTNNTRCVKKTISQRVNNNNYLCVICETDMESRIGLDKHLRGHMGQPIYQCDVCGRHFKLIRNFQAHYLTHEK